MATRKTTRKPIARKPLKAKPRTGLSRGRQIKLFLGLLFLLVGAFGCLAIVSYFFTWQADQDGIFSSTVSRVMKADAVAANNWGGRLGASLAHLMVYRAFGIASLAIALWFCMVGLQILKGNKAAKSMRYLRWAALLLLILAPILTFTLPKSNFPWGGAWGKLAIGYLDGFIGSAGISLVLIAATLFIIIVVFALDVKPFLDKAKMQARKAREAIQTAIEKSKVPSTTTTFPNVVDENIDENPSLLVGKNGADGQSENEGSTASDFISPLESINESYAHGKQWDMQTSDKQAAATEASEPVATSNEMPTTAKVEEEPTAEELAYQQYVAEKDDKSQDFVEPVALPSLIDEDPLTKTNLETTPPAANLAEGLSFEVVALADEAPSKRVAHGAHISIQDGEAYAPELDLPDYKFPTLDLLEDRSHETIALDKEELEQNKTQIINTLKSFGIEIQRITATVGPTVTLYEIVPAEGVRISKIRNLEDDIALNLAALGIRIIAPIPGRGTIGIEVPNANKQIVSMRGILQSDKFINSKMSLPIALGKKIDNENYIVDLATMPHLLMAGATGQGKSVGINAILVSLLYKKHPSQVKFVMVDPKKVELSIYRVIEKHFLAKLPNEEEAIITDTKKVINTLNALCIEMDNRYELLKEAGVRNIKEYNEKFIARRLNPEKGHKYLPFIVLVVDEFADLIMTAGKEVEMPIARLAQLARAIGIHLIIATQRPSVNVITGTIKANFPGRVAFKVSAKVDSRTILDTGGADQLIGRGDMLISHGSELLRVQCAFVDTPEVDNVVNFIGNQRGYASAFELPEYEGDEADSSGKSVDLANRDKLFEDCARTVVGSQSGSTSNLQRKFNLGYNRAGRIMDQLESAGIVGPAVGSKPREVYFSTEHELEQFLDGLG